MRADERVHDPSSRVAKIVHTFQTHFKISTGDIADYFASFYKDDELVGGGSGSSAAQLRRIADGTAEHGPSSSGTSRSNSSSQRKGGSDVKVAVQSTMMSPFFDLLLSDRASGMIHAPCNSPYHYTRQ